MAASRLDSPSIGDRIRELRRTQVPRLTQRELAERAEVSVELVGQLERGVRQSALLPTLTRLARALDVDLAALVGRAPRISGEGATDADPGGVTAVRRALTVLPGPAGVLAPDDVADLGAAARLAWSLYWQADYPHLTQTLPELIGRARLADADQGTAASAAALSDVLGVTASLLVHLGHVDLAQLAMERAVTTAVRAGDELRSASLAGWMSWLMLHQVGLLDEAQRLAEQEAAAVEPRLRTASPQQLSVWGSLLVSAAVAAGRRERPDEADDLLGLAEAAAVRLDGFGYPLRRDHEVMFGRALVTMQQVDVAVVTDRPSRALEYAGRMPADSGLSAASRARHASDVAFAQVQIGRLGEAMETLLAVEAESPAYLAVQGYPRSIVAEVLERAPRTPGVRGLAGRLHIAA